MAFQFDNLILDIYMIKNIIKLFFLIFYISCSKQGDINEDSNKFNSLIWSDKYEYVVDYENTYIEDSLRIDKFTIYKINDNAREIFLTADAVMDSVFENNINIDENPNLAAFLESANQVDLSTQGNLIRELHVTYTPNDNYFNTLFTEQSFDWDLENMSLSYLSTGIVISLDWKSKQNINGSTWWEQEDDK